MLTKKSIYVIFSLCITMLLFLISPVTRQANAGIMEWSVVETPDITNYVIVSPSEINFTSTAPDGLTIYCSDVPNKKVYRSKDGGYTWTDISSYLSSAGATLPSWNIIVAPDNPNIVAAVTSISGMPRNIFLSMDGGNNWQNLNFPSAVDISALDISRFYGNYDIAVGSRTNTGAGRFFIFRMSSGIGSWADQGFTGDVLCIKFSPNYSSNNSVVFVSADSSGTYLYTGIRDTAANTTYLGSWPPLEITTNGAGTSPKASQIKTADVELPADFPGQGSTTRKIFVSTCDGGISGNTGIFRIDDTLIYHIFLASGNRMISSISYFGTSSSGRLLAGEVKSNASSAAVDVWYCPNAAANCPPATCLLWQKASKHPTGGANSGNANAQITWNNDGSRAFCGTSSADLIGSGWPNGYLSAQALDESAFSYSSDNGNTWNQIGLIDTQVSFLADFLPTYNSETLYLASINSAGGFNGLDSIWRIFNYPQSKSWERVLCLLASGNDAILRMNLTRPHEVFLGIRNTNNLFWSSDNGQTWQTLLPNVNLTDFCVSEINAIQKIFVLDGSNLRSGEYSGTSWKWGQPVSTSLASGHTITAASNGIILVGDGGQGAVSISLDAGNSFNILPNLPVSGNVHVILDTRVRDPYLVHATTDDPVSEIYSWIPGISTNWLNMDPPDECYYGLAQLNTFYGCHSSGGNSSISRSLQPELVAPFIEWDTMDAGLSPGVSFTREPAALKLSAGSNLWAIDNRPYTSTMGRLWQYCDCISGGDTGVIGLPSKEILLGAPIPVNPVMDKVIEIDTLSNKIPSIEFSWQHVTPAAGYDLILANDVEFKQIILEKSIRPESVNSPSWILPEEDSPFKPGNDYYWKVRVNRIAYTYEQIKGQWSDTMHFSTMSNSSTLSSEASITLLSPADGAIITDLSPSFSWENTTYMNDFELMLSKDPAMGEIILRAKTSAKSYRFTDTLEKGTTYYWQVIPAGMNTAQPSSIQRFTIAASSGSTQSSSTDVPVWLWILVAILAIITTAVLMLVFVIRREGNKN